MKMNKLINTSALRIYSILFASALIWTGCTKEDEIEGPSLVDLYGDFSVLEDFSANAASVDFANGQNAHFTALFSKNVNWTLRIKGESSGAEKIITGFSNELNSSNSLWNGTTTALPMFHVESCMAILEVEAEDYADTVYVSTTSTRNYPGLLLADFEDGFPSGWTTFVQSGANMSFIVTDSDVAAQGQKYYDMGGEVGWDWLIGLIDINGSVYNTEDVYFPLSSNGDNVYFNVLLYNPEGITNALTLFQFREDDNGDGIYQNNEDMWSIEVSGLTEGWHRISSKYSSLATLINGAPSPAIGNGLYEPEKLLQVSVLFLANPTSGYSQNYMDFMIFTENAPLQP